MSSAPVRGIVPHRQRRHHHHHHHEKHQRRHSESARDLPTNQSPTQEPVQSTVATIDATKKAETEEKRPKVNPIFLWAAQREQRIVEVRCEDYDKRNRIKLTKTAQGWRSIPRTALTACPSMGSVTEDEGEQQETLSTTSKNEEKENTSRERVEIKQAEVDDPEDARVNDASRLGKVDETQEEKERRKRKRKKHDFPKNKKRKSDSETEEVLDEVLITTNWKMKKRRKMDKDKKRKKLCIENGVVNKDVIDNSSEVKVKEETKKEFESIADVKKTEEISEIENNEHKVCINSSEKAVSSDDDSKKCNDLQKLQKNRHLQPRVVLEQLHLSQLPTRIHQRLSNRAEPESNSELNDGNDENNIDEIVEDSVEKSNCNSTDSRDHVEHDDAVVNREDLQEILNMLDSNDFPIPINESKQKSIESKNMTRNCTKIGVPVLDDEIEDSEMSVPSKDCAKNNCDLTASEKRSKFGDRDNIKHKNGSKSLDETIERLEKSVNYKSKIKSVPNMLAIDDWEKEKRKVNEAEIKNNKISDSQNEIASRSPIPAEQDDVHKEKDTTESSKILNVLRNTPGLSISLAKNYKKLNISITANSIDKNTPPTSRSPDSQTEACDRVSKSRTEKPAVTLAYPIRSKTASPNTKHRVESPESTVSFPKHERYPFGADDDDADEEDQCDSQEAGEVRSRSNYKSHIRKDFPPNHEDYQSYYDDDGKNYPVDSTKVPNLKPLIPVVFRNSEAQAKYANLSRYHEVDNVDEQQLMEEFHSQVSPQPSGIPYSISSSRRSSSTYLERLLPSPPCSVSCSEDARNDLTLKGILSTPNNADSRNQDKNDQVADLTNHCDSELSPSYNHSEERYSKESLISDKSVINHRSQRPLQENLSYLEMRNHGRPMSSGDVHNPFAAEYISPKRPLSAEWTVNQQRMQNGCYPNNLRYLNQKEFMSRAPVQEMYISPTIFLDPASQLRELIKTSGHLIPDPLLVPRDYLPLLAGAPLTEIPKLLATRPELRLPEALSRPELLRDPDLLVISLAHLQHVLDHGEGPANHAHQSNQPSESKNLPQPQEEKCEPQRPKLSCKPIGKLMPAPMDLSSNKTSSHPPLLRVRSGLLKQEPEVSSTANSPDDSQLWHPLFGSHKQRSQQSQQQQPPPQQQQQPAHQASWHRTTLASS